MRKLFFRITRRLVHYYLSIFSFEKWQKYGYHVMRVHYYSPVPDTSSIPEKVFSRVSELPGINMNEESQLDFLKKIASKYRMEYDAFPASPINPYDYHTSQTSYRCLEAQILYCMIREKKPRKMIEIGSGYSTMLSAMAILKNQEEGSPCHFTAIEPYPNDVIRKGFPGLSELIQSPVEDVPMLRFTELDEGDILFIDSTHSVKIGGDVVYEILEVLPRLKKGVIIHIHDIFLPYEYPKAWYSDKRFWTEQYLLQAFLQFNDHFKIIWSSHLIHRKHAALCASLMKFYDPEIPYVSSFWIQKIK